MIRIVVVDTSAESRNRITAQLSNFLRQAGSDDLTLIPRVSVQPLSPYELKFHAAPDVCVLGEELSTTDGSEISRIRKLFPECALLVRLPSTAFSLTAVDQLARLGADEVFPDNVAAADFLRRLLLVSRKRQKGKSGSLILIEGAKGGVGVTSVAAALGESLIEAGKTVALIDLDTETQDLSRFLQARPFINENLGLILRAERPLGEESVTQCLVPVWEGEERLKHVAPPPEADEEAAGDGDGARSWLGVLEVLDEMFDCVVVDVGSARSQLRRALRRAADKVIFVVNNDPASLFASVDRVSRIRGQLSPGAELIVVPNGSTPDGITTPVLRQEFMRAAELDEKEWAAQEVPHCRSGQRWPGSGGTLFSQGSGTVKKSLLALVQNLGYGNSPESSERRSFFSLSRFGLKKDLLPPSRETRHALPETGRVALPAPVQFAVDESPEQKRASALTSVTDADRAKAKAHSDVQHLVTRARLAS